VARIDALFDVLVEAAGSDLHLGIGYPPTLRLRGDLVAIRNEVILAPEMDALLMEILPEGEQFVGTRGGGMDHAACLGSRSDYASLIGFAPLSLRPIRLPAGWKFLVAHSLQTAEKSGAAREEYNARRRAGAMALEKLGLASYREAMESDVAPAALATKAPTLYWVVSTPRASAATSSSRTFQVYANSSREN